MPQTQNVLVCIPFCKTYCFALQYLPHNGKLSVLYEQKTREKGWCREDLGLESKLFLHITVYVKSVNTPIY